MSTMALARLLQLASPTLPVGAYSYSQGLEAAVEAGTVCDEASAGGWIGAVLAHPIGRYEAPLAAHLLAAWRAGDRCAVSEWNAAYLASRETAELRAETLQMGYSLLRLVSDLGCAPRAAIDWLHASDAPAFPTVWTCAAAETPPDQALTAYLWSWLENQVLAAVKLVPLGQTAGQRLLLQLGGGLPAIVERALDFPDDELSSFAPGLAIASSRHETQYSRLFRS
jgi:urease accessory protein